MILSVRVYQSPWRRTSEYIVFDVVFPKVSYRSANRQRDRVYGRPAEDAKVDTSELADKVGVFLPPLSLESSQKYIVHQARDFRYIP